MTNSVLSDHRQCLNTQSDTILTNKARQQSDMSLVKCHGKQLSIYKA